MKVTAVLVWDGAMPAKCSICGVPLGPSLVTLVRHCIASHPGTLHASLDEVPA